MHSHHRKSSEEQKLESASLIPKSKKEEGWNFLGLLSLFIYGPGHIAMEVLNGIDQPVFTPIRIATAFSILLGCSIAGIFANVFIPMFIIGAAMGILYAWVKFKNEKMKYQLTSHENLQSILGSLRTEKTSSLIPSINFLQVELKQAAIDFYGITDEKEKAKVEAKIIDGQIRIALPPRFTAAEPKANPPPSPFISFTGIWRSIEDFYKRHNVIDRIWSGLTNYSMYYWIFWFTACAIAGNILVVPIWWVFVGALIAQWVLPFIINSLSALWLKFSTGLPLKEMFVEKKSEEQKIAALERDAAEKVIPYFLATYIHIPPEEKATAISKAPLTAINNSLDYLHEKRQSTIRVAIAGLNGFFQGWLYSMFAWWPISDGILYGMTLFGIAAMAPAFIVTSLVLTVVGFSIAVIIGSFRMVYKIKEMKNQITENKQFAKDTKDRLSEEFTTLIGKIKPKEISLAKIDPNLNRIVDDDSFLEYLQTLKIEPRSKTDIAKSWLSKILNIGKMFIACFGGGVLIVRFLLLPGTIGAIIAHGFSALTVHPIFGIAIGGATGAWLAVAIAAAVVGVIWASIKIYENHLQRKLERQKQLVEALPTRLKMLESYATTKKLMLPSPPKPSSELNVTEKNSRHPSIGEAKNAPKS